jgi:hypothetical protein
MDDTFYKDNCLKGFVNACIDKSLNDAINTLRDGEGKQYRTPEDLKPIFYTILYICCLVEIYRGKCGCCTPSNISSTSICNIVRTTQKKEKITWVVNDLRNDPTCEAAFQELSCIIRNFKQKHSQFARCSILDILESHFGLVEEFLNEGVPHDR